MERTFTCTTCGTEHGFLEEFPGALCLDCYKQTPEAHAPITAEELARMWGGK